MHYVRLKKDHILTLEEAEIVKSMELSTPEDRRPNGVKFEVYFKETESKCYEFINNIKGKLREQFEIFEV